MSGDAAAALSPGPRRRSPSARRAPRPGSELGEPLLALPGELLELHQLLLDVVQVGREVALELRHRPAGGGDGVHHRRCIWITLGRAGPRGLESRRAISAFSSATSPCTVCTSPLVGAPREPRPRRRARGRARRPEAGEPISLGRDEVVAAGRDLELVAAVLSVGRLVGAGVERAAPRRRTPPRSARRRRPCSRGSAWPPPRAGCRARGCTRRSRARRRGPRCGSVTFGLAARMAAFRSRVP